MSDSSRPPKPVGARWRDLFVVAAFLVLIFVPPIAFATGLRAANEENRVLATAPPFHIGALAEPAYFSALDAYLADNFPPKNQLVWAHAALGYYMLGTSLNPDVIVGDDDWLFIRDSLEPVCPLAAAELLAQYDRVGVALGEVGVSLDVVIVPDKQAIYPDRRPARAAPCTDRERPAMIAGMRARTGHTTELWSVLESARASDGDTLLFWPQDTHWSPTGAMAGFRAVVTDVSPSAWDDKNVVTRGTMERVGDLSRLMGLPTLATLPTVALDVPRIVELTLPSISLSPPPAHAVQRMVVDGVPSAIPGQTLIIHDSAFATYANLLAVWFQDSTWLHVNELIKHPEIVAELPHFDRVIFERVERYAYSSDFEKMLAPVIDAARQAAR